VNKLRGTLKVAAVKAPGFWRQKKGDARGYRYPDGRPDDFRRTGHQTGNHRDQRACSAKRVVIDKDNTTLVDGAGEKKEIEGRVKQIRTQIEETTSDYDREKLQERLAKLVGGVAVINVGAATESEMKEKKARVEDALNATKAAVEEGVIPGGGVGFIRSLTKLGTLKLEGEQQGGVKIVIKALEEPIRWIANNAGFDGSIVTEKVRTEKETMA